MKGPDSFVWLLVIAIVIVVVMLVFSGYVTVLPPGQTPGEFTPLKEFSLGTVGFSAESPFRTIRIGELRVGETQQELLKEVGEMDVSQGIAGGQKQELTVDVHPSFLELNRGVRIIFSVVNANALGNLKVKWNGKGFFNSVPSGRTEFTIPPENVKGENILVLEADGPGILFWSATTYTIRDFKVFMEYGPQKLVPFDLLPSELQSFNRGEIQFFGSGNGILDVKVNGLSIYSKIPLGQEKIAFNLSSVPLNAGSNVIAFVSTQQNILSGAAIRLFSLGSQLVRTRTFELNTLERNSFANKQGRIDFTVAETRRQGLLTIKLNGQSLDVPPVKNGVNTVTFSPTLLREGENTLEFSGTGDWDISTVKVGIGQ